MCDRLVLQQKIVHLLEMIITINSIHALMEAFNESTSILEQLQSCPDDFADLRRNCEAARSDIRTKAVDYAAKCQAWLDELTTRHEQIQKLDFNGDAKAATHVLLSEWVVDVLDGEAQQTLEDWRRALLDGTTRKLDSSRTVLEKQTTLALAERVYLETSDKIDQLHTDAEHLASGNALPAASGKYREADQLAQASSSQYPAHVRLQLLAEHERTLREQKATAAEIISSALQFGQWGTTINKVKGLPPNEPVLMQDPKTGQITGTKPASEAVPELERMARNAAGELAEGYAQEALRLVQKHNPRGALDLLKRRSEIDDYLPDGAQRKQLDAAQAVAEESLKTLEGVEVLVPKITEQLGGTDKRAGLNAWEALAAVPSAFRAAAFVQQAADQIIGRMRSDIEIQQATAQRAFEQIEFEQAGPLINWVEEAYKDTTLERDLDSKLADDRAVLNKLEPIKRVRREMLTLRGQITEVKERLSKARIELSQLRSLAAIDVHKAFADFENLKKRFSQTELSQLPELNDVASLIQSYQNTHQIIERLLVSLNLTDTAAIRDTIDQIEKIISNREAQDATSDVTQFRQLLTNFKTRQVFLQAHADQELHNYGAALDGMRKVAEHIGHRDQAAARSAVGELEPRVQSAEKVDAELLKTGQLIAQRPDDAYRQLQNLSPATAVQTRKVDALRDQARTAWHKQIVHRLETNANAQKIDLDQMAADLRALRIDLDDASTANEWEIKLNGPRAAQKARNLGHQTATSGELQQAVQAWEDAIRLASETYIERYRDELRQAELRLLKQQISQPFSVPNDQKDNARALHRQHILEIIASITSLQERYAESSLYVLAAEHYEQLAQSAEDQRSRADYYDKMRLQAQRGSEQTQYASSSTVLKKLIGRAKKGQEITGHIQSVLSLLQADQDLKSYQAAVHLWNETISPLTRDVELRAEFDYLRDWWNGLVETRLSALRTANPANGDITIDEISNLARRNVLSATDPRGSLFYHQRLGFQPDIIKESGALAERLRTGKDFIGSYMEQIEDARSTAERMIAAGGDLQIIIQSGLVLGELSPEPLAKALTNLREVYNQFLNVVAVAKKFEPTLNGDIAYGNTTQCNAKQVKFEPTSRLLSSISDKFSDHDAVKDMHAQLERAEKWRQGLLDDIRKIDDYAHHERYQAALKAMQRPGFRADTLARNGLANCFQVIDVLSASAVYETYDGVKPFLEHNNTELRKVIQWAEPFLDGSEKDPAYPDHLLIEPEERTGSTIHVFDWPTSRKKIEDALHRGDFDAAYEEQARADRGAMADDSTRDADELTIKRALDRMQTPKIDLSTHRTDPQASPDPLKFPPIIAQSDDSVATRYAEMQARIPTARGQRLLQYIQRERLPIFRDWLGEIEACKDEIKTYQQNWENGLQRWQNALRMMAVLYDEVSGSTTMLKGGRLRRAQSALNEALSACEDCSKTCPENALLLSKELSLEHWLCQWAKQVAAEYQAVRSGAA